MAVKKQHVVSQVLLKQWADQGGELVCHSVASGHSRRVGTAGIGRVDEFVQLEFSHAAEQRWSEIENRAGNALRVITTSGQGLDVRADKALRDLLALHLLRSRDMDEGWAKALPKAKPLDETLAMLEDPAELSRLVFERRGIHAAGPEILDAERRHWLGVLEYRLGRGGLSHVKWLLTRLDGLCRQLDSFRVQIGWTGRSKHLLISDAPAFVLDTTAGRIGLKGGVTFDDADQLLMPIGPHHLMALSRERGQMQLPPDFTDRFNSWQLWNSRVAVMYAPDSDLGPWVDEWRQQNVHPDDRQQPGRNPNRR